MRLVRSRLRANAVHAAGRMTELEHTLLRAVAEDPWTGAETRVFREVPQLREQVHYEALLALCGILEGGADADGHLSDWLRNQWYLYSELERSLLTHVHNLEKRLVEWATDSKEPALALAGLHAQVPDAFDAFRPLEALDQMEDFTGSNVEPYWDASALSVPWFAIDWASFGREELFDATGRRAAEWLREHRYVGPRANILQIGCGAGRIEKFLAPAMGHVYGADVSAEMVRLARMRLADRRNVTIVKTDGKTLPFPDGSIDNVFAFLVFIHIHDRDVIEALLQEAFRVLCPGGHLVVTMASYSSYLEKAATDAGLTIRLAKRTEDRRINSFDFFWDWLWIFERPRNVFELAETGT